MRIVRIQAKEFLLQLMALNTLSLHRGKENGRKFSNIWTAYRILYTKKPPFNEYAVSPKKT